MQVLNDNETVKYVGGAFYFYLSIVSWFRTLRIKITSRRNYVRF